MSDIDSNADSISDSSNAHVDVGGGEGLISVDVRELCNRLRANDPRVLGEDNVFIPYNYITHYLYSEAECIALFQALEENTSVQHVDFSMFFERHNYNKRSALVAAAYLESSKTLQTLNLGVIPNQLFQEEHEVHEKISLLLSALSRNTSVTKLNVYIDVVRFTGVAFQELLTCTQTLQKLRIVGCDTAAFDEVQIADIASGFANSTTLQDLEFDGWREVDLAPVLTALHCHPALQKIHFSAMSVCFLPSLPGLEALLRSQNSKVKELVLEQVGTRTVGLRPVMQELGRNTTVTNLAIRDSS